MLQEKALIIMISIAIGFSMQLPLSNVLSTGNLYKERCYHFVVTNVLENSAHSMKVIENYPVFMNYRVYKSSVDYKHFMMTFMRGKSQININVGQSRNKPIKLASMESDEDYKSFRFQFKYKESKKMQDKEVYFSKSEDGWSQLIKLNEFKIYYELPQLQFNCSEAVKPECRLQSLPFGKCLVEDKCLGKKDSNSLFGEYFPGNCYQQPASCNGMTSNEITQTFATTIAARKIPYQSRGRVLTISIATQNSEVHSNSSGVQQDINLSRTIKYKEQTSGSCNFGPESADSFSQAVDADKLVFKEEYYRRSQIIDNTIMKSYEKIEDQDSAEENNTIRQKDRHILGKFRNEVNNMTESFNTLTVPQLADVEKIFFGFKRGIAIISVALAKQSCESSVILRTYLAKLYEGTLPEFLGKFLLLGLMQCSKFTVGDFPALSKYCASSRAIKYGFSYNCKVAYDYLDRKRSNELRTTVVQLEVIKNCTTSQGCESHRRDAVVRECEKLCPGCLEMDWYDSRELLKRTIIGEGPMMEYRQLASKSDISKLFKGGGVYHVSRGDVVISRKGEIRVKEEKLVVTTLLDCRIHTYMAVDVRLAYGLENSFHLYLKFQQILPFKSGSMEFNRHKSSNLVFLGSDIQWDIYSFVIGSNLKVHRVKPIAPATKAKLKRRICITLEAKREKLCVLNTKENPQSAEYP